MIQDDLFVKSHFGSTEHYLADKVYVCPGAETRFTLLDNIEPGGFSSPPPTLYLLQLLE